MTTVYTQYPQGPFFQGFPGGPMNADSPFPSNKVNFTNPFLTRDGPFQNENIQNKSAMADHLSNVVTTEYEGYQIRKNEAVRVDGLAPTWDDAVIAKLQHTKAKLIDMTSIHRKRGLGDPERDLAAFKSEALKYSIRRLTAQRNANEQHQQATWVLASVQPMRKERVSRKGRVREIDHVVVILKRERKQNDTGRKPAVHAQMPCDRHAPPMEANNQQHQPYAHAVIEKQGRVPGPVTDVMNSPQTGPLRDRLYAPADSQAASNPRGQQAAVAQQQRYHSAGDSPQTFPPRHDTPYPNQQSKNGASENAPPQFEPTPQHEQPPSQHRDFAVPVPHRATHQDKSHPVMRNDEYNSDSDDSSDRTEFRSNGADLSQITPLSTPPQSPTEPGSPTGKSHKEELEAHAKRFGKRDKPMLQMSAHPQRQRNSVSFADGRGPDYRALQRTSGGRDQHESRDLVRWDRGEGRHQDRRQGYNEREMPRQRQRSDPTNRIPERPDMRRALTHRMARLNVDDERDEYRPSRHHRDSDGRRRRYSSPAEEFRPRRGMSARPRRDWYDSDRDNEGRFSRPKSYVWDRR